LSYHFASVAASALLASTARLSAGQCTHLFLLPSLIVEDDKGMLWVSKWLAVENLGWFFNWGVGTGMGLSECVARAGSLLV
jgi:hypothetical protein